MTNKTRTLDELNKTKDNLFTGYWELHAREMKETQANIDRLKAAAKLQGISTPSSENDPHPTVSSPKKL